jgi:hypothetical protein
MARTSSSSSSSLAQNTYPLKKNRKKIGENIDKKKLSFSLSLGSSKVHRRASRIARYKFVSLFVFGVRTLARSHARRSSASSSSFSSVPSLPLLLLL